MRRLFFIICLFSVIVQGTIAQDNKGQGTKHSINSYIERIDSLLDGVSYPSIEHINQTTELFEIEKQSVSLIVEKYRVAEEAWLNFKLLCYAEEYEDAFLYYYSEEGKNISVYLRNTTASYFFYKYVLHSLDQKYDSEHSLQKMYSNLQLNMLMTIAVIQQSDGRVIPAHYKELLLDFIDMYIEDGDFDKAKQYINEYGYIVFKETGSEDKANEIIDVLYEKIE